MATFKAIIKKEKMRSDKTWNGVSGFSGLVSFLLSV